MAIDIERIRKINGTYGISSKKEYLINKFATNFNRNYQNTLSEFELLINTDRADEVEIDGIPTRILLNYGYDKNERTIEQGVLRVSAIKEEMKRGSIVKKKNYNSDTYTYYIVTSEMDDRHHYDEGYMRECDTTLKWINEDGKLLSLPIVSENKSLYTTGVETDRYLTTPSAKLNVTIQANADTIKFDRGMRFLIGNNGKYSPYKITLIDSTKTGIYSIVMDEGEVSANDDIINGIPDANNLATYSIAITNGVVASIDTSQTLQLNVEVKKNNVTTTMPIEFSSSDDTIATIDSTGLINPLTTGTVVFTAILVDNPTMFATISVDIVAVPMDNFSYNFVGDSVVKLNQTKNYVINKYNNGILTPQTFTFSVIGNVPSNVYELTVADGNNVSLKCLKYPYSLTLRATDDSDGTVNDKVIQLKGLL